MIVHHLNTNLEGGAAIAARRVHDSVTLVGCQSKLVHLGSQRTGVDPALVTWKSKPSFPTKVASRARIEWMKKRWRPSTDYDFYFLPWPGTDLPFRNSSSEKTILHFHWMQGWLPYSTMAHTPSEVVLTLHDMNAFTGGCIYDWDCAKHETGCGNCPQLQNRNPRDTTHHSAQKKREFWESTGVHVVAPSLWMLNQAKMSLALKGARSFTHIPYGLSLTDFRPVNKQVAREALGLCEGPVTILFGAAGAATDPRKGLGLLLKSLHLLPTTSDVRLLTFGPSPPVGDIPSWVKVIHLGSLSSSTIQSLAYSAADLTIVPSLQDNSPQVVLESFACGTPVLGTNVGGISELIVAGEIGEVASPTPEHLAAKLSTMIRDRAALVQQGEAARSHVMLNYSLEKQGYAYLNLYSSLNTSLL